MRRTEQQQQVVTFEYVLSEKEARAVKVCLDYAFHRLTEHNKSGIHGQVNVEARDELRRQFDGAIRTGKATRIGYHGGPDQIKYEEPTICDRDGCKRTDSHCH